MGLKKKERAILSSKAVRDELLHSLVIDQVLPRMTFLNDDDIRTIKAEPRNDNRIIELSNLLEKKLSKLSPLIEVLSQFGDTYIDLIALLKGHGLSRKETYVHAKFSSKKREPKSMDADAVVAQALCEKMPIYSIQPFLFFIQPFRIVLFTNHPQLENYHFETLAISKFKTKNFRMLLINDAVLRDFLELERSSIRIMFEKKTRPLCVFVTEYSQKDLPWFHEQERGTHQPIKLDQLSLCLKGGLGQPLKLAPVVKAISTKFTFSALSCYSLSLEISKVCDLGRIMKSSLSPETIESISFSKIQFVYDEDENEQIGTSMKAYKKLRSVSLSQVQITIQSLCQLIVALKYGAHKCELSVTAVKCLQEPGAFEAFCGALHGNEVIESLSVNDNGLYEEQLAALFHTVPSMTNLRKVNVDGNHQQSGFNKNLKKLFAATSVDKVFSF